MESTYNVTIKVTGSDWAELIEAISEDGAYAIAEREFEEKDYGDLTNIDWKIVEVDYDRDAGEYNVAADVTGYVEVEVRAEDKKAAFMLALEKAAKMNFGSLEVEKVECVDKEEIVNTGKESA